MENKISTLCNLQQAYSSWAYANPSRKGVLQEEAFIAGAKWQQEKAAQAAEREANDRPWLAAEIREKQQIIAIQI